MKQRIQGPGVGDDMNEGSAVGGPVAMYHPEIIYRDPRPGDILHCTDLDIETWEPPDSWPGPPWPEPWDYLIVSKFDGKTVEAYYLEDPPEGPRWVRVPFNLSMRVAEYPARKPLSERQAAAASASAARQLLPREVTAFLGIVFLFVAALFYYATH